MQKYIALLRAINVGGRIVKMEALRAHFESIGCANVETYIASGNVIFDAGTSAEEALRRKIEVHLESALGHEVSTFLRTPAELAAIAAFNDKAAASAEALNVAFLHAPLDENELETLMSLRTDIDDFRSHGREVYWLCKTKQSDSKFSNALFERKLRIPATFRGMNTVRKLAALCPA
ncbi:DUF1697 domain-containing protein [Uliginosibacterium sp. H3]|uniref:DUF1697 domain-containing protein n=1 Tax=Uliginosibacterium silvisoli TaxID=3114758 RepID=A0ABU6KAM4_9RHOO|nr:DUF1697 domain-containing protein [Uliginosibacterium sp. H3]